MTDAPATPIRREGQSRKALTASGRPSAAPRPRRATAREHTIPAATPVGFKTPAPRRIRRDVRMETVGTAGAGDGRGKPARLATPADPRYPSALIVLSGEGRAAGMSDRPTTIDDYLRGVNPALRPALEHLRATLHAAAPGAEEGITYNLPCLRLAGKTVVCFGAGKAHCALYPYDSTTTTTFADALKGWKTSKGAIQFTPEHPLPDALVRRIVAARIAFNQQAAAAKRATAKGKTTP